MGRLRDRGQFVPGGGRAFRTVLGSIVYNETQGPNVGYAFRDTSDDVVNRKELDNPMQIVHVNNLVDPLNGQQDLGFGTFREYVGYIPPIQCAPQSHLSVSGIPSVQAAAAKMLANTNPGRAEVSAPVYIGELRDLPHMIKGAGDFLIKLRHAKGRWHRQQLLNNATPSQYLSYQFGWKPLFNDLRSLLTFQDTVDKRVNELQRLFAKGGLKRRLDNLGSGSNHSEVTQTISSVLGDLTRARLSKDTTVSMWGTVRWRPAFVPKMRDNASLRKLAHKAVFGLSIQAEDAWNLMPWTWLADWFSTCGDYLAASNNRIPSSPQSVCIMTNTKTTLRWRRSESSWVQGGNSYATLETKQRNVPGVVLPTVDIDFLSLRQLSILGALFITRANGFRS